MSITTLLKKKKKKESIKKKVKKNSLRSKTKEFSAISTTMSKPTSYSAANFPAQMIKMTGTRGVKAGSYGRKLPSIQSKSLRNQVFGSYGSGGGADKQATWVTLPKQIAKNFGKKKVKMHKAIAPYFDAAVKEIEASGLSDQMKSWEGAYAFRNVREGDSVSIHSWGAAFDINYTGNEYKRRDFKIDPRIVRIFKKHGFAWGGEFGGNKDGMHFEPSRKMMNALKDGKKLKPDGTFLNPNYKETAAAWEVYKNQYPSSGSKYNHGSGGSKTGGSLVGKSNNESSNSIVESTNVESNKVPQTDPLTKLPLLDYSIMSEKEILAYIIIPGFNNECKKIKPKLFHGHIETPVEYRTNKNIKRKKAKNKGFLTSLLDYFI